MELPDVLCFAVNVRHTRISRTVEGGGRGIRRVESVGARRLGLRAWDDLIQDLGVQELQCIRYLQTWLT